MDKLFITIDENGTIKTTADKISGPNHSSAESFLSRLTRYLGGAVSRERKSGHKHDHNHVHEQDHEHTHE